MDPKELQRMRELRGISREKLAAKIGSTGRTVFNWETGATQVPMDKIRRISEVLDWPMITLLGLDQEQD
jgi:transcriptional regulator with XRE-family HTH domain